jgi:hypothetical protein
VLAQPHLPLTVAHGDDRILDGDLRVAGEHDRAPPGGQVLGPVGIQGLDPPVLGAGRGAGEIEAPAAVGTLQHDRALEGLRAELVAIDLAHRLEGDPVG